MSVKTGKANYGKGKFTQRKYFKLKDGESVFRILPPLGNLADQGRWSVFYSVHYGYKNSQGKMRVFMSPLVKNRKTNMVEVPDAALERIENLKAQLEKAKRSADTKTVEKLKELLQNYNLDNNHYVNVMDTSGNVGVLKLRHRAKLALDSMISRLQEQGVDPLSLEDGRYFVFRRTGNALDTSFQVDVLKEKLKVEGVGIVERDVVHKITDDTLNRIGKEAAELDKLFKRPTAEEVARIVKEGPTAVDEIFGAKEAETSQTEDTDQEEDTTTPAPMAAVQAEAPVTTTKTAATTVAKSTTVPAASQNLAAQSDEEFLKSLGL